LAERRTARSRKTEFDLQYNGAPGMKPGAPQILRAPHKTFRARRIVEDSTLVRRDECNAAMEVL
jgi:hypothetical protein